MRRREVLGACGAVLTSIAGCLSNANENDTPVGNTSTTSTSSPTPTTQSTQPVSVISLQPVLVDFTSPDSIGVRGGGSQQFLFLDFSAPEAPPREEIAFRFDGNTHQPVTDVRRLWYAYGNRDEQYDSSRGKGWLLYELPDSGDASSCVLAWPDGEWQPGESLRKRLETPMPPLSLSLSAPEEVTVGTTPTLTFTVTNEGDVAGRFVAALNRSGPSVAYTPVQTVSRLIPANETKTFELTDTDDVGTPGSDRRDDGQPDMTYRLEWSGGQRSRGIRVVD